MNGCYGQIVEKLDPEEGATFLEEMAPDAAAVCVRILPKETRRMGEEMPGQEAETCASCLSFDAPAGGI